METAATIAPERSAALWRAAALGFWVLVLCNGLLLALAWSSFAAVRPDYFNEAWPTFSRALTIGNLDLYGWLAGIAGAGLLFGAASVTAMRWRLAAEHRQCRRLLLITTGCAALASLLGIVHYYHVTVSLAVNHDLHMLLSYVFFFGMTGAIAVDWFCCARMPALPRGDAASGMPRLATIRHATGWLVLAAGALFLLTYILKDAAWNPRAVITQKIFVLMETAWIVLVHAYAVLYVAPVRAHFRRSARAFSTTAATAARSAFALVLAAGIAGPWHDAAAASPPRDIGGSGRIQPAGGVLAIVGPAGHIVERVAVRDGDRVRKGAVLLVLADRAVKSLERDLAAERVRNAQRQVLDLPNAAALEAEAARLTLAQARSDAEALAGLDARTVSARERRQRLAAVAQAEAAVKSALAKVESVKQSSASELRMAQSALKLADAALSATQVLAPADATVLEVQVQAGSALGHGPAVLLADTTRMYVVADVFEGDLPRLKAGQPVKISNAALGEPLEGTVERIGRVIDPVNRLARVWVRLLRAAPADRFIGMQVDVRIDSGGPARQAGP